MPIYHVLEQEIPAAIATTQSVPTQLPTNEIPVDEDAPPIPKYNPDCGNVLAVENPRMTNCSPTDNMYAEVARSAKT